MKQKYLVLVVLGAFSLFVPYYAQGQSTDIFRQEGIASWYGKEFEGRPTASGEIYDSSQLTAAHPNLPFGTVLVVTNRHNDKKVTVRVNDRGPFVAARIIDVSRAAAEQLDMIITGTAPVLVESVDRIAIPSPPPAVQQDAAKSILSPPATDPIPVVTVVPVQQPVTQAPINNALPVAPAAVPAAPPVSPNVQSAPVVTAATTATAPAAPPASHDIYSAPVVTAAPVATAPVAPVVTAAPAAVAPVYFQAKLTPEIVVANNKTYRLQVGSYKVARNAVDAFERLKNAGLNPAYERYAEGPGSEYFRVVLAGIRGSDVHSVAERLGTAGFREALIREEK